MIRSRSQKTETLLSLFSYYFAYTTTYTVTFPENKYQTGLQAAVHITFFS